MSITNLQTSAIFIDAEIQQRIAIDAKVVEDYADAMEQGQKFPPLVVYFDSKQNVLADGFHRFEAHKKRGHTKVACEVREGTREDAILYAATDANRAHGLRRTQLDKRKAVHTVMDLKPEWSNRDIAKAVGVSHTFVNNLRQAATETPVVQAPSAFPTVIKVVPSNKVSPSNSAPAPIGGNVSTGSADRGGPTPRDRIAALNASIEFVSRECEETNDLKALAEALTRALIEVKRRIKGSHVINSSPEKEHDDDDD